MATIQKQLYIHGGNYEYGGFCCWVDEILCRLGDRHGENILYDEKSGECLHVDLNCLFEKGLEFDIPERVPFRLTHNMVDAFGVFGVEGPFRKSCEMVMKVLHDNRELLMSVLETFLHDPLCVSLSSSFSKENLIF